MSASQPPAGTPSPSVEETMAGDGGATEPARGSAHPEPGGSIGRYENVERIGDGAMGVVYRAHDPKLDRTVAIKLIKADGSGWRMRMIKEARAIAQVDHPNVVRVLDVGTQDRRVFVVMELVDGVTLKQWLAGRPPLAQIIEVMTDAGRGLAAAHRAGVIHRDFKPDNVLVGADRRVRVVDFGLAKSVDDEPGSTKSALVSSDPETTHHGFGTPAYMSPEQAAGGTVDPRSDQFSFCVTLFEAVHGVRPFSGETLPEITFNLLEGRSREVTWPRGTKQVRGVVDKGLQRDRDLRFESMDALLSVIARGRWGPRRVVAAIGVLGVATGAFALWATRPSDPCAAGQSAVDDAWNDARRTAVGQALSGSGVRHAADTYSRVRDRLDAHASQWSQTHAEACALDDADVLRRDRALVCLRDNLRRLRVVVRSLQHDDPRSVHRAIADTLKLPAPRQCLDAPDPGPAPPAPAIADAVAEVQALVDEAQVLRDNYDPGALQAAEHAVARAREVGYQPAVAAAVAQRGWTKLETHDLAGGREDLEEAGRLAEEHADYLMAARAYSQLAWSLGHDEAKIGAAETWIGHAYAAVERMGSPPAVLTHVRFHEAGVVFRAGDAERSLELFLDVVSILDEANLQSSERYAASLLNAGQAATAIGRFEQAERLYAREIEITLDVYGANHPQAAVSYGARGLLAAKKGDYPVAVEHLRHAKQIYEANFGPHDAILETVSSNLASVLMASGELDEAEVLLKQGLERRRGDADKYVDLANLAEIARQRGDLAGAREGFERALAEAVRNFPPGHPVTAKPLISLSGVALDSGQFDRAYEHADEALEIARRAQVADQIVNGALISRGLASAARGDDDAAIEDLTAGVEGLRRLGVAAVREQTGRLHLGKLLWRSDPERAVAMVTAVARSEATGDDTRREAEAWLAEPGAR